MASKFVSSQPQYSALWRGPEAEVIPLCERNGISQVVWSPLAQGVLTGKYRPGEAPPPDSRAKSSKMNRFIKQWLTDDILEAVDRLRPVAEGAGLTMSQLALAWILRQPNVASAIVGATRPEQVRENVAAAGVTLSDDTLRAIDDVLDPRRPLEQRWRSRPAARRASRPPGVSAACQSSSKPSSGAGRTNRRAVATRAVPASPTCSDAPSPSTR